MSGDEKKKIEIEEDDEKDIEEFKEVMNTLENVVPAIIKGIADALYSGSSAEEFGKQVANFYKEMVNAGMDKDMAYELTKKFMESRDISGVIKKILSQGNWSDWVKKNPEKLGEEIREEVEKEMKEEGEE